MDFSKLSQNEKLAVYGAGAVIIGGLVGYSYGLTVLAVLAAIAMLAIVLLPQISPGTNLPGSRGSLMLLAGGVAGVVLALALLLFLGTIFVAFNIRDLFFLIAVAGGLLMAWVGWREFQAEGGKFQVGSSSSTAAPPAAPSASSEPARSDDAVEPVATEHADTPPAEHQPEDRPST
ncbi:MAG: hypothetical protein K5924_00365 [Chloroflexi bacterium]|nr:hypothetical protein [Chloroflexota bacterium]